MFAHIAGTFAVQGVLIHSEAMEVKRKKVAAIFFWPVVSKINHHAAVGMATTCSIGGGGHALLFEISPVFLTLIPMKMISGLLDQFVEVLVVVFAIHALVARTGYHVPEVANNGIYEKELAVIIPVMPPRVRCSVADHFKDLACGVITPNAALDGSSFGLRSSGFAHHGSGAEDAVATV